MQWWTPSSDDVLASSLIVPQPDFFAKTNARKSPIIPWMIVKPLKMMNTGVVHAGPADDVYSCKIIWMTWNKKGKRQRALSLHPDHLEFIDPECSPAPLHSKNLFFSLLLHNRLSTGVLPYSTTLHNCLPKKWLTIWFRAGHTWYLSILVHHRTI